MLFERNLFNLKLSNEDSISKLNGSDKISPLKINLSLPIKELLETNLIILSLIS